MGLGDFYSLYSVLLDGAAEYLNADSLLTGTTNVSANTKGTWSCWMKIVDITSTPDSVFMSMGDTNANTTLRLSSLNTTGKVRIQFASSGTDQWLLDSDAAAFTDNTWHFVVLTQDATSPIVYVDSVAVAQSFTTDLDRTLWLSSIAGLDNVRIGNWNRNSNGETNHFNGNLKDVAYWNAALSAAEVSELYHNGAKLDYKKHSKAANLVTWYKMDNYAIAWNKFSYLLDGAAEYINIDSVLTGGTNVSANTKGTISAWVRFPDTTPAATETIVSFGDTNAVESIRLDLPASGNLRGFCRVGGVVQWNVDTDANGLTADTWHMVTLTHNATSPILYIDSVAVATTFATDTDKTIWVSGTSGVDNARIGSANINSLGEAGHITGNVTEVCLFSDGLDQTEVTELYNAGVPFNVLNHSKTANLVSYFPMINNIFSWNRYSYLLDGSADYINIDSVLTGGVESDTKGTISAWVRMVDVTPAGNEFLISVGDTNANERFQLFQASNGTMQAIIAVGGTNQWYFDSDAAVGANNTWIHIAVTHNGTAPILYVNGVLEPITFTITTDKTPWMSALTAADNARIGNQSYNSGGETGFFNGNLTEVCFFNDDLDQTEITELYNAGVPFDAETHSKTANLVAYYPMINDTFSTNWTVVDEKSGLNGTTASVLEGGREAGVTPVVTVTDEKNGNDGTTVNVEFEDVVAGVDPTVTIYDEMGNNNATSVNLEASKMEVDNPY